MALDEQKSGAVRVSAATPDAVLARLGRGLRLSLNQDHLPLLCWNVLLATAMAVAACESLVGRTNPLQATLPWLLWYAGFFVAALVWLTAFSIRWQSSMQGRQGARSTPVVIGLPLLVVSTLMTLGIYLSDQIHHQSLTFFRPVPAVVLMLTWLATTIIQETALHSSALGKRSALQQALSSSRRWVLPVSLLLLGLLQGFSFLWAIGNDFTRYWAVSDAIGNWAGYPASVHQAVYIKGGMYRYSIELPLYPMLLLASFSLSGHNTLAAHLPGLFANTLLPLLLWAFYRKAGLRDPLAFAATCVVVLFPFFRLYTLNTPLPDPVFVTLLVTSGWLLVSLIQDTAVRARTGPSRDWLAGGQRRLASRPSTTFNSSMRAKNPYRLLLWPAFGILGGLTALTRPEGLVYVGMMFLALLPSLFHRRFYLAVGAFLLMVTPFSLLMMSTFGIPWPMNAGSTFRLHHIVQNWSWLERGSLRWYAEPLGLSTSTFTWLVGALTVLAIVGILWMVVKQWRVALLPLAAALHTLLVFTVEPRVAGADQWFDFFRHISYGIPFVTLALFHAVSRIIGSLRGLVGSLHDRFTPDHIAALLALAFCVYALRLMALPSTTYGQGASQLLTSDAWLNFGDIVAHPYPLPQLPFVHKEGVLVIDPSFEYMDRHLDRVGEFFHPISALNTGRGSGYQISSLLLVLAGAVFAWLGTPQVASARNTAERNHRGVAEAEVAQSLALQ